jgi:hypothetical protein
MYRRVERTGYTPAVAGESGRVTYSGGEDADVHGRVDSLEEHRVR